MVENHILRKDLIEAWERYMNGSYTCDDLAFILDSIDDENIQEFNEVAQRELDKAKINMQPTPEEKEVYQKEFAQFFAEYQNRQKTQQMQQIQIVCDEPFRVPSQNKIARFIKTWYAAAAAILLLGLLTPFVYLYVKPKTEQISILYVEESTQRGEIKTVLLPDQTKVTLNVGSSIKYPANFTGAERSVELYGEALFDVTSDPARPFTVKTENLNIRVVGTVFDVKEYTDDLTASVSVASGKVEVSMANEKVMLEKNRHVKMEKATGNIETMSIDADNYLSWTDGTLYFNRTPIREVVNMLNRHYPQADIELADGEYHNTLTGKYNKDYRMENYLKGISYSTGLKYKKTGVNKYVLFNEK